MPKSSQKKGQNYIPFLKSTYPEMQRKTSSRQSGARAPGQRWAGGGSGRAPEWRVRPRPPVGGGAPAVHQGGVRAPGPRLAGGAPDTFFLNLHTLKCKKTYT